MIRVIRRDPEKRYACMQDLLYDLQHQDPMREVTCSADPSWIGGRYRQVMRIALIVRIVALSIVALELLAQFVHNLVR